MEQIEATILRLAVTLKEAIETRADTPNEQKVRAEVITTCLDALAKASEAYA